MHSPDQRSRPRDLRHAAYGVLATVAGLAAAHLVAALTVPAASPVLAVGSTVIDLTPTPLKEWAIRQFGSADKLVLVGSVTLVVLLLAAVAGIVAARRETAGLLIVVGLAGVAGVLAVLRPGAGPFDMIPALVAAATAATSLWWLHRVDDQGAAGPSSGSDGPSRRGVVLATGGLAAAAVTMGALGRWVTSYRLGGTDIALETAGAAVLHGRVGDIARMVALSRRTMGNIHQNVAIALGLKAVFLVAAVTGTATLWMAVLADTGASVIVVANALRLLRAR